MSARFSAELKHLGTAALAADNSARYIATNAPARELTGFSNAELLLLVPAEEPDS